MAYEAKDGDISVFVNDKGGNDRRPDWRGDALINGVKYRVSLWEKKGGKGPFLSGRIELPRDKAAAPADAPQAAQPAQKPIAPETETGDGIPF